MLRVAVPFPVGCQAISSEFVFLVKRLLDTGSSLLLQPNLPWLGVHISSSYSGDHHGGYCADIQLQNDERYHALLLGIMA